MGKTVTQQPVGIPLRADLANLFLCSCKKGYISSLASSGKITIRHFHLTNRFLDDICSINDGSEFEKSFAKIYPTELQS